MSQEAKYVVELLNNSISPIESIRNEASNKIIELELNSNFLITLLDIATSNNAECSKLAFIILKNSTCKISSLFKTGHLDQNVDYRNALEHLKAKLLDIILSSYNNNCRLFSKDLCILVRRICRQEFPLNWTDLYEHIVNTLSLLSAQPNEVKLFNMILLTHHIFKERISMRLYKDRAVSTRLVENLFPYISKFWAMDFMGRWKVLESPEEVFGNFNELQLKTSVYLDSVILNFYSDFLKNVHKNRELLELLTNLFYKLRILSKVNSHRLDKTGLVRKNILRIIKGIARIIDKQPFALVFVDFSIFVNLIFDHLVESSGKDIEDECIKLLTVIFTSNSMNNEKYANIYFDQVEQIPKVDTSITPIISPKRTESIDVKTVLYYDSYEALVSSRNFSNQSEIDDLMEQQLTFCFYKLLSTRGGFVPFLDTLRTKYLKLDLECLGDWNEDEYPTDEPTKNMVPELISSMNISLVEVFNFVFNSVVKFDASDFFDYDTYLQLYTLCFREFYKFHSYKHFSSIIDVFTKILDLQKSECTKLLAFRVSRIINLWCKKPLISQQTKSQILSFLLKCVCSEDHEAYKGQHLVPLYNLYINTVDENMWMDLFRNMKTDYIIHHLSSIVKINVPIIRTRSLELICNICLEYEEDGHNLGLIVSLYNQLQSVEICEAIVRSIHEFISKLDWVNCYTNVDTLNKNFTLFVLEIINSTVERDAYDGSRIRILSKYTLISELFVSMWLSFLRILPLQLNENINQYFYLFGPLLNYLSGYEALRDDNVYNKLCVDLLTEYVLLLGTYIQSTKDYSIENRGEQVVFTNMFMTFDLLKLYQMCSLLSDRIPLILSVYYAFGITQNLSNQCLTVVNEFFNSIEECARSPQQCSYYSSLILSGKSTSLQPMRYKRASLSKIETLLPVVNRIVFSTQLLTNYIKQKNADGLELWVNEVLLTLVNIANVLRGDPFMQFGFIILSCYIVSEFPNSIYPFMRVEKKAEEVDIFDLGWDNINIHDKHQGIFLMCYVLRIISNVANSYRIKYLAISNEKVEGHAIPPSNRFEYVKAKSLTNLTCLENTNLFQDALSLVLRYVVEATRRTPTVISNLLMSEENTLNSQVAQIIKNL